MGYEFTNQRSQRPGSCYIQKDGGLSYPQPLELKNSDVIDVTIPVGKLSWLRESYGVNACRNLYRIIHKFAQSPD